MNEEKLDELKELLEEDHETAIMIYEVIKDMAENELKELVEDCFK